MKLQLILGSVREGRQGKKVADWLLQQAKQTGWEAELLDLADWPLPFFNEAKSPDSNEGIYQNELAQQWSAKIASGDAFVIVTPEYNHGYPAVLKNVLDWLYLEWGQKPVAFASYSTGLTGGARAVEQLRPVVLHLQMVPVAQGLQIPNVEQWQPESSTETAQKMFAKLTEWSKLLASLRK